MLVGVRMKESEGGTVEKRGTGVRLPMGWHQGNSWRLAGYWYVVVVGKLLRSFLVRAFAEVETSWGKFVVFEIVVAELTLKSLDVVEIATVGKIVLDLKLLHGQED